MKLVAFVQKYSGGGTIYINADKVVAVYKIGSDTCVAVEVPNTNGAPFSYLVEDSPDQVIAKLA